MAKIKLTKNELKTQKDALKRFTRYLPTLELKKKQLIMEIKKIKKRVNELQEENKRIEGEVSDWIAVYSDTSVDLQELVQVEDLETETGNIAGIDIPVFKNLTFKDIEYDDFETPLWVDKGLNLLKEQITRRIEWQIAEEQQELISKELQTTIQRIKLFEEIKIPEARENIRKIQIFLGDQQTAEVVRGKIAKKKIQRKKAEAA
ncbi:MAG: V-type ATP synthase subunit D [candidate division KSB1 bacterium]|nr:V-type ATP synthase subunit D [candidate division KSB1 bacterium]